MSNGKVISHDVLMAQFDGDRELFAEVAEIFLEDCPRQMNDIRMAIAAGDAPALEMAAHTLKGSASSFAAPTASAAAEVLERIGRSGDLDGAREALGELEGEIAALETELRRLVDAAA
jgi:HPt (histidine-containing phosphotransfer) domain-containing protein